MKESRSKVLVTGSDGYIGGELVKRLKDDGHSVVGVDLPHCDVANSSDLADAFREGPFTTVYHLAAQSSVDLSVKDPMTDMKSNIEGTLRLLAWSSENGVENFVFVSSGGAVYGSSDYPRKEMDPLQPISPYGLSKATAEGYCEFYEDRMNIARLRLGNVYGVGQKKGVIYKLCKQAKEGMPLTINGYGEQKRDYISIGDTVEALVHFTGKEGAYNIGTGVSIPVNEIPLMIEVLMGHSVDVVWKEDWPSAAYEVETNLLSVHFANEAGWTAKDRIHCDLKGIFDWIESE